MCYRSIAEMDAKEARRKLDLKKCAKDLANMRTNIEKEEANVGLLSFLINPLVLTGLPRIPRFNFRAF